MPTPEVRYDGIPSAEAINHLRQKLSITTEHWDDMLKEIHAKAFTVAGATKIALLQDLRAAVDKAVTDDESIGQFRNRFDEIVKTHGWEFRGQYAWRTRIIYDTNMRTAHMAGKWEQIQRTKATRPFLQYRTAGDKRVRPEHARWDDTILPIDDPFWDTHYPPNGWGCRCTVRTLSRREMDRKGLNVSDPPEITKTGRTNTRTGEFYGQVPDGIDTGWDYNVGKAWIAPEDSLGQALVRQPPAIREQFDKYINEASKPLQDAFAGWARQVINEEQPLRRDQVVVGYAKSIITTRARDRGIELETATIALDASQLQRIMRDAKADFDKPIPSDFIYNLPSKIANPLAVLWENSTNNIIYVIGTDPNELEMKVFLALSLNRKGGITNSIRSGGLVRKDALQKDGDYELIFGSLDN